MGIKNNLLPTAQVLKTANNLFFHKWEDSSLSEHSDFLPSLNLARSLLPGLWRCSKCVQAASPSSLPDLVQHHASSCSWREMQSHALQSLPSHKFWKGHVADTCSLSSMWLFPPPRHPNTSTALTTHHSATPYTGLQMSAILGKPQEHPAPTMDIP